MAEIINLRRARKEKQRSASERQAEENRVRFGRTKEERARLKAEQDVERRRIEGHRRDLPSGPDEDSSPA